MTTQKEIAGSVIGTFLTLILCVVAPLALSRGMPSGDEGRTLALAVTVAAGARLAWLIGDGARRLAEFSFWLFIYVFLGAAPLIQIRSGTYPETTPDPYTNLNSDAMYLVCASCLTFFLGVVLSRRERRDERANPMSNEISIHRSRLLAYGALAISAFYISAIGPASLFMSRQQRSQAVQSQWGDSALSTLVSATVSMSLLVAFAALVSARRQLLGTSAVKMDPLTATVLGTLLLVVNPISSPRYVVGTVLLSIAAIMGAFSSAGRFRVSASALVIGLLFVFPAADAFRHDVATPVTFAGPGESLKTGDFDAFAQLTNSVAYVDQQGPTYGRQAVGVAAFWVPRNVWPGKPVDTGILLGEFRGYRFKNLSAPLPAELYVNGSWPLLVGGMTAFGFLVGRADDRIVRGVSGRGTLGILASILPFYMIINLRGSLLQSMAYLVVVLACARFVGARPAVPAKARVPR